MKKLKKAKFKLFYLVFLPIFINLRRIVLAYGGGIHIFFFSFSLDWRFY